MSFARAFLRKHKVSCVLGFSVVLLLYSGMLSNGGYGLAQESASPSRPPETQSPPPSPQQPQPPAPSQATASNYDKAIFLKPIPADQLVFLNQFQGVAAKDVMRDKQFQTDEELRS
jgi:hypothetical protein